MTLLTPKQWSHRGKPHHIAVVVPCTDMMYTDFVWSLTNMINMSHHNIELVFPRSSVVADNRNAAVGMVLNSGLPFTHILWLDFDMVFPHDVIDRLLNHKRQVVGASYLRRTPPHSWTHTPLHEPYGDSGLEAVAALPSGMMLVGIEVYKQLPFRFGRWYEHYTMIAPDDPLVPLARDLYPVDIPWPPSHDVYPHTIGEDTFFCLQCRDTGIPVWRDVALSHEIGHIGKHIFTAGSIQ